MRLTGPVSELELEVAEAVPESGWQPGLTDRSEATEPLPDLLSRLVDHLGEEAVCSPSLVDAWRPEGAWEGADFPRSVRMGGPIEIDDPVVEQERWERSLEPPRPALLLPEPERIEVRDLAGRPLRVLVERGWISPKAVEGPERLQGEWWADSSFDREYWAVCLDGQWAWLYREHGRWYRHGWFD